MPQKKNTTPQPALFHREVPKMPEGYYTPTPNPNLRRFVEENATHYDSIADDYNVPPFAESITSTKTTAIYNMHTYWSKKPHDAIQQYIKHYTKPGDIVFDPFSGSGGTSLAALMEGRTAIAIDLSPAATFITKNYCTPIETDDLQQCLEKLKNIVEKEINWLYHTRCDVCGSDSTIYSTVYSALFKCDRCLSIFPLLYASSTKEGYNKVTYFCPYCKEKNIEEEISLRTRKIESVPLQITYYCYSKTCNGEERKKEIPYPRNDELFPDLIHLNEIEKSPISGAVPNIPMLFVDEGRWGLLQRPYHGEIRLVSDFYSPRNLRAIALIVSTIQNSFTGRQKDVLLFAIEAISMNMSKLQGYSTNPRFPNSMMKGTLYTPPVWREYNVLNWLEGKVRNLTAGYSVINQKLKDPLKLLISTESATATSEIPNDSIDYIFTDPPYSYKIQYGELNFMWEAWMGLAVDWKNNEIIVNDSRGVDENNWAIKMKAAMTECFRVLKPNRWISVCYHDSSEGSWALLQDLMAECGFISDTSESTVFIDTDRKSWKQLVSDKVTQRDLVINFRKPREGEVAAKVLLTGEEDPSTFSEKASIILREALERHPGAPADRLYDELVSRMVRKGQFQRHNFDELLRTVAEENSGRWYLLDTADKVDETEARKENAAAARLETFMQAYLKKHPGEGGVHYSNLFEEYLPIGDKPRRLLQDWLLEYFYKTEDGTWRPPANEDEYQIKIALRLSGELRHIKRFANALSEGIPPSERDRPSNAATLAEWIYQCRRAGLYEIGRVLYERGGLRFDSLSEERQLQVEEDYQLCVKRGAQDESKPKKSKKKDQPSLFT